MEDSKEDDDLSLGEKVRRQIEEGIKFWQEFERRVVEGLPPVDGKYMPPNIKDAVAWLYANVQDEDIITIKLRGAGGTMHYRDGHILAAYLVAQFRIADNEALMENTTKDMMP